MNRSPTSAQRRVLIGAAITLALALLFPPLHVAVSAGQSIGHHIGFLLTSPSELNYTVNTSLLALEVVGILAVAALLYLATAGTD